jgi:hypothetical protein
VIVYSTDRYPRLPLTISGPGAGPEVTATGVLNDLIGAARAMAWRARPEEGGRKAEEVEARSTAPRYAAEHGRPAVFVF